MLALGGCSAESTESSDVKTSGIYADLEVQVDGTGNADAEATLRVGGADSNTYLQLANGDTLTASNGVAAYTLTRRGSGDWVRYGSVLPDTPDDAQVTISLHRPADQDAPSSTVSLASAMTIAQPAQDGLTFSRFADDLVIAWTPVSSAQQTSLSIGGGCLQPFSRDVTGFNGTLTISAKFLIKSGGVGASNNCAATIRLERPRSGQVDPNYGKGGRIIGTRYTQRVFLSTP